MKRRLKSITRATVKRHSGHSIKGHALIRPLREGFFVKVDIAMTGEAPKDFLHVYEYGRGRKSRPKSWPAYIAKVGQKYYPNESITEQLLTRIGQLMGLNMAQSRLMWVRGQLRFLSEYFLRRDESLIHGAEIFAGYLANDDAFVQKVEAEDRSNEIFTLQVVEAAMRSRFPAEAESILQDFVRLIGFDAVVGNNDRHFFNWGVITHISGRRPPRFSPIYDSARALFWNTEEAGLTKFSHAKEFAQHLQKYVRECYPKTGWDGMESANHFQMIQQIVSERPIYREALMNLNIPTLPEQVSLLMDKEFSGLFTPLRKRFILDCLRERLCNYKQSLVS